MKTILTVLGILCVAGSVCGQTDVGSSQPSGWRLTGVIDLSGYSRAAFEMGRETQLLAEGHRASGLEVQSIRMDKQEVVARVNGNEQIMSIPASSQNQSSNSNGLNIVGMRLDELCSLYQELKGQTLLLHPKLPKLRLSLEAQASSKQDAARAIELLFEKNGICASSYLEKFVAVHPVSATNELYSVTNRISISSNADEAAPTGVIDFRNMPMGQVFVILGEYVGKKTDRFRSSVPFGQITFRTQTPLTRAEIILAFQVLFTWNGVEISEEGDELKAVPIQSSER